MTGSSAAPSPEESRDLELRRALARLQAFALGLADRVAALEARQAAPPDEDTQGQPRRR